MENLLTTAIEERRLLHMLYDGKSRMVEPYLLGRNDKDECVFLGRQISPWLPKDQSWQIFRLNRIYGLLVLDSTFKTPLELIELPAQVLSGLRLLV